MGLFKDIYCSHCGKKTNILTRTKLLDGAYLCLNCISGLPPYISSDLTKYYSYEDFKQLKEYVSYSENQLKPKFVETACFAGVHIDEVNSLFYFQKSFFDYILYLKFENVSSFDMDFIPEDVRDGVLSDKVIGKVLMTLRMNMPEFLFVDSVGDRVKVKASKSLFGSKIVYGNPDGMEQFMIRFMTAWESAINACVEEEPYDTYNTYHTQTGSDMTELEKAKTLFMIDDIDHITLSEVKEQRNRLIRMFHPDTGSDADTKYAQKINAAYDIIKQYLSLTR